VKKSWKHIALLIAVLTVSLCGCSGVAMAATGPSSENPQSGSVGLQGTVASDPPTRGATITSPTSGQAFTQAPVSVNGLCPSGLLVKVFANNVFVGSALCVNGSYSLQIDLFDGKNDIVARVFDALDQPGPDSNIVSVTFTSNQFKQSGFPLLTLTSNYARRGASPGQPLIWPIIMTGGTGPYAISISWGDNKPATLLSREFPGTFDISHVYDAAGVYTIVIKATDKNGMSAYLQLIGEANGAVTQATGTTDGTGQNQKPLIKVLWLPAAIAIPLIASSFWLGKKYELSVLRKQLEDTRII
jgi:hypothetical protein